jgi:predicted PurR-regulated permease PerM
MSDGAFIRRVIYLLLLAGLAAFVWAAADVLLLLFGAILFGVALNAMAEVLSRRSGLSSGWALAIVIVLVFALVGAALFLFGSQLSAQFTQLSDAIPKAIGRLRQLLQGHDWGQRLIDEAETIDLGEAGRSAMTRVASAFRSLLGILADAALIVFAGVYLAAQPALYRDGVLLLVPPRRRRRAGDVLAAIDRALRLWLLGQLVAMLTVGAMATVALWLLGVPSPFALGLIAGLTEFIPFIGPIMAAVPAILAAVVVDPMKGLHVALAYFIVQQIENHLLQPLVQREVVSLPPVLTIFAAVTFGLVFGPLGLLLATPLAVVGMVAVRLLYVEGALGEPAEHLDSAADRDAAE